jgi:hypothetical protein
MSNEEAGLFKVASIGIGQAGTNLAQSFIQYAKIDTKYLCTINLSKDDINQAKLVPMQNRLHLDDRMFGAGKKRSLSKTVAREQTPKIVKFLENVYTDKQCNIFFVFFSTSGGTGSGAGPFITALIESEALAAIKPNRAIVIGIPLIGDLNEGQLLLTNTLSCLKEIDVLVKEKLARFAPVYNQSKIDIKDDIKKWQAINEEASRLIERYLFHNYVSEYSNLDPEDRFVLLMTPGLHSFLTFNPQDPSIIQTAFMLPDGASIQKLGCELPKDKGESRFALIKALGANVTEPNFVGLYDSSDSQNENATPIVHFAGFNNLANFVQPYQVQISRLDSVDTTGSNSNGTGSGFDNTDKNIEIIDKKNSMIKSKDVNDIFSKLM